MKSITQGHFVEVFFDLILVGLLTITLTKLTEMSKKFMRWESRQEILDKSLSLDIQGSEKALVLLSEKIQCLPDILRDEIHRSTLALIETIETHKPIKPNNWDSFREAFKGPVRIDVNERN